MESEPSKRRDANTGATHAGERGEHDDHRHRPNQQGAADPPRHRLTPVRRRHQVRPPDPLDLEARCLLAFAAAISSSLIVASHGSRSRDEVLARAAALVFEA